MIKTFSDGIFFNFDLVCYLWNLFLCFTFLFLSLLWIEFVGTGSTFSWTVSSSSENLNLFDSFIENWGALQLFDGVLPLAILNSSSPSTDYNFFIEMKLKLESIIITLLTGISKSSDKEFLVIVEFLASSFVCLYFLANKISYKQYIELFIVQSNLFKSWPCPWKLSLRMQEDWRSSSQGSIYYQN